MFIHLLLLQVLPISQEFFCFHGKASALYKMSLLLGLVALIRPTNLLLILLIPFFAPDFKTLKQRFISLFNRPFNEFF